MEEPQVGVNECDVMFIAGVNHFLIVIGSRRTTDVLHTALNKKIH